MAKILKKLIESKEDIGDKFFKYEPPIHYTGPGLREQITTGNNQAYTGDISLEKIGQWISYTPTTSITTVVTSGYASIPIDKWRTELLDFGKVFQVEDNRTPLEKALSNRFKILS